MLLEDTVKAHNELVPGLVVRHYASGLRTYELPTSVLRTLGEKRMLSVLAGWVRSQEAAHQKARGVKHAKDMAAVGCTVSEIARALGVCDQTARNYLKERAHDA